MVVDGGGAHKDTTWVLTAHQPKQKNENFVSETKMVLLTRFWNCNLKIGSLELFEIIAFYCFPMG